MALNIMQEVRFTMSTKKATSSADSRVLLMGMTRVAVLAAGNLGRVWK